VRGLAEVCVRRPVFAAMTSVALLVVGAVGYVRLGVDRFPAVDLPSVRVQTRLPGAAPEEVETEVSEIASRRRSTPWRASSSCARSRGNGTSIVIATFELERDIDVAAQDVRDRVARVLRRLPDAPTRPSCEGRQRLGAGAHVALAGERSVRELTRDRRQDSCGCSSSAASGVGEVRSSAAPSAR
jgi:HAE1 family hydrophobic/amphiphilic exporter-1